jgi:hypothetical protein
MTELTQVQQQALDASPETPPRLTDPGTDKVRVLLRADHLDWIRGLLPDVPDAPRLVDPRSGTPYALLPLEQYERFKAFFEDDPLTPAERAALLRDFGKRAGWDDPAMDVYDDLDPRKQA